MFDFTARISFYICRDQLLEAETKSKQEIVGEYTDIDKISS